MDHDKLLEYHQFAKKVAAMMHYGQEYGSNPYTYHLQQVEMALNRFGFKDDWTLRIVAWLHDLIEDTEVSYSQVREGFGEHIADIVYAVTNEMGRNRAERFSKTYPKIKADKNALIIKLADRIANIEFAKGTDTAYINMYKKEMPSFKEALYEKSSDQRIENMWKYLETLFQDGE